MPLVLICFLSLGIAEIMAQPDSSRVYENNISSYLQAMPREELFLHLAKPHFITGETAWFRIYHFSSSSRTPIALSRVAYVEMVNSKDETVLQEKVKIDKNGGSGWFYLPTSLNSGNYRVIAYTNWMKNFKNNYFESEEITIINPFTQLNLQSKPEEGKPDLQFLPEGGKLLADIPTRLAFRAMNANAKGIDFKGVIIDDQQDTVLHFSPKQFGIGSVELTPERDTEYKALIITPDERTFTYSLPEIYSSGYSMRVDKIAADYEVSVRRKNNGASNRERLYLAGFGGDQLVYFNSQIINTGPISFNVRDSDLQTGINRFVVFTSRGLPLSERMVFKYPENNLRFKIDMSDEHPGHREPIEMALQVSDKSDLSQEADLSISIYLTRNEFDEQPADFLSYAYLLADLKGHVENPSSYFNHNGEGRTEEMDNLMLTHGWSNYNLEEMLNSTNPSFDYIPEFIGQTVSAQATYIDSDNPVDEQVFTLSIPNNRSLLYTARSDQMGNLVFETGDVSGDKDLVFRKENSDGMIDLTLESPFGINKHQSSWSYFNISTDLKDFLIGQSVNMQVSNIFDSARNNENTNDSISFYGIPDALYMLDDYTRFPVMEEVMREYVSGVNVRRIDGRYLFRVLDQDRNEIMKSSPLILLDGVPVTSADEILDLDPRRVKRIEIVQKKYFYGPLELHGIVAYYSYNSDMAELPLNENAIQRKYKGYQQYREFYTPKYDAPNERSARLPDFRNQLYWNPSVITGENGKTQIQFTSSDLSGQYKVVVHGMSSNGLLGSTVFTFEVPTQ
jgi:hypothetical protein